MLEKKSILSEFPYPFLNPAYLHIHITVYSVNGFHKRLGKIFLQQYLINFFKYIKLTRLFSASSTNIRGDFSVVTELPLLDCKFLESVNVSGWLKKGRHAKP